MRAALVQHDEEMAEARRCLRDERREAAVIRQPEGRESTPLESSHAQDERGRGAAPPELEPVCLPLRPAGQDDDRVLVQWKK